MAKRGAPVGNNNAGNGKLWTAAIHRALKKRTLRAKRDALDDLAEKFLEKCDSGDMQAFNGLADRLEGKVPQGITGTGEDGAILISWSEK